MPQVPLLRSLTQRLRVHRRVYSIGIHTGPSPFALAAPPGVRNPVLTHHDVSDARAFFVADPFLCRVDERWHMFFEAMIWRDGRRIGVISHAESRDGFAWRYGAVVLAEQFHLSYPHVFVWNSEIYMIPESMEAGAVRLYRADPFPNHWTFVADILKGSVLSDSSIFYRDGAWWLFSDTSPKGKHDTLRLFHAPEPTGPWTEHPRSPIISGDRSASRPAGRVVSTPEYLIRFAQDCDGDYGLGVRAFDILRLDLREYQEREYAGNPLLTAGRERWKRSGMHHVDAHQLPDGQWLAAVDGHRDTLVGMREIVQRLRRSAR